MLTSFSGRWRTARCAPRTLDRLSAIRDLWQLNGVVDTTSGQWPENRKVRSRTSFVRASWEPRGNFGENRVVCPPIIDVRCDTSRGATNSGTQL